MAAASPATAASSSSPTPPGPVPGLAGRYFAEREPRYYKGPRAPSPCDLADTELVIFGR